MSSSKHLRASDIKWDCSTHARPVNAACEECARVVNALRDAFDQMRAIKMRRLATEAILGFAASQYGLAVVGDYGRVPEAEHVARRQLHVAARVFADWAPKRRRR